MRKDEVSDLLWFWVWWEYTWIPKFARGKKKEKEK